MKTKVIKPITFLESALDTNKTGFIFHTGQILPEFIGCETGGISVQGSFINYFAVYPNLLEEEKKEMREGELKTRVAYVNEEIFVMLKFGSLPWSDIAFTPYLSGLCFEDELPEQYAFLIILVEGTTGEVQGLHLRSVSAHFSANFNKLIKRQLDKPFNLQQHYINVMDVYNRYTTKQLLKFSF